MFDKIFPLQGAIQNYAWGGKKFIPDLLNIDNSPGSPCAELWLGAHPKGPSKARVNNKWLPLDELIKRNPIHFLGASITASFQERLPFLFKILDVNKMLSIQAHPNKKQAEIGFELENQNGVPLDDPQRVYRDNNHKPEIMVALTDFWLLHGFKNEDAIQDLLEKTQEFRVLLPFFNNKKIKPLYKKVMEADQSQVDKWLKPLQKRLENSNPSHRNHPDYWANKAFEEKLLGKEHLDRGVFSIYFLNLVKLSKGEGIYQAAGIPHAYLEGANVELMANSDNVFRGGLTIKHIDVPELLDKVKFEAVVPQILNGKKVNDHVIDYPSPAPDFALRQLSFEDSDKWETNTKSPEAMIVLKGEIKISDNQTRLKLKKGDAAFVCANTSYKIECLRNAVFFKACVP